MRKRNSLFIKIEEILFCPLNMVLLDVICMEIMLVMEQQIEALAEEIQPMLSEVRDSDLLKDVETIAKGLADASGDLRYYCLEKAQ